MGALVSKRDEFWETAPSYEGKKEVWEALRSAADALERGDLEHAQLVIDTANIKVPNGNLSESYDDLGIKYCIPAYCISAPDNLISEKGSVFSRTSKTKRSLVNNTTKMDTVLRLRLSTENEKTFDFDVSSKELVQSAKLRLQNERDIKGQQRWFCQGRVLVDNQTITQARIPEGFVIQVILIPKL
ncbi:Oidioi.mRNA.OKI2018_I69.XSR.g14672.t1.cds [Oikopleura dioica]|uniref:Oidioi.mRNA.OKI2018_I69.XSR.g14672.t1.cds n=1 Tax=Oikopleura dioica TaxID=34765 RepID=A0ABN7SAH5_OIKDI|nr:Oidioi.mRNA.OKI2018_I69.XSR.g14672.t1.cds [Oikopleura dioica]